MSIGLRKWAHGQPSMGLAVSRTRNDFEEASFARSAVSIGPVSAASFATGGGAIECLPVAVRRVSNQRRAVKISQIVALDSSLKNNVEDAKFCASRCHFSYHGPRHSCWLFGTRNSTQGEQIEHPNPEKCDRVTHVVHRCRSKCRILHDKIERGHCPLASKSERFLFYIDSTP